jgi:GNAT superfamily N-acetyltransferase
MQIRDSQSLHRNLIASSCQLLELDPEAASLTANGAVFCAGGTSHPVIANAAFRAEDGADPEGLIASAREFFNPRGRGFSLWVRDGEPADTDLVEAARAAGLQMVYAMPEMVLSSRPQAAPPPAGVELRRVSEPQQAADYWAVAASSYASLGFPPEVFAGNSDHEGMLADNLAAFVAHLDDEPVGIALTIVSDGVAGIYWVGSVERARGMGIGQAVTAAAVEAGFALGAGVASLQASHMGKPVYERMGFETVYDYQLWMAPPP